MNNQYLIFVDCEAVGQCPVLGELTEFGAVDFKTRELFMPILEKWERKMLLNNLIFGLLK